MRSVLAIALALAGAEGAVAQTVQDRYGPPRAAAAGVALSDVYPGAALRWAGKREPAPPPAPVEAAPARPEPMVLASRFARTPAPARVAPAPSPAADLPKSLYDAPRPAAPPAQAATPRAAGTATRLYSLHREYGLSPDAIPEPPASPRYVLVGPPEGAPAPASVTRDDVGPF